MSVGAKPNAVNSLSVPIRVFVMLTMRTLLTYRSTSEYNINMAIEVSFSDNAGWVLDKAKVFLSSKPVHHNVILTLLHARVEHCIPGHYWVVTEGNAVVGVVFQSPLSFRAIITPMVPEVIPPVVDAISDAQVRLPGVSGDATTVAYFAGQWAERQRSAVVPFMGQRIYEVDKVEEPTAVRGHFRKAVLSDRNVSLIGSAVSMLTQVCKRIVPNLLLTSGHLLDKSGYGIALNLCRWQVSRHLWKVSFGCSSYIRHQSIETKDTPVRVLPVSRSKLVMKDTGVFSILIWGIQFPMPSTVGWATVLLSNGFNIDLSESVGMQLYFI